MVAAPEEIARNEDASHEILLDNCDLLRNCAGGGRRYDTTQARMPKHPGLREGGVIT